MFFRHAECVNMICSLVNKLQNKPMPKEDYYFRCTVGMRFLHTVSKILLILGCLPLEILPIVVGSSSL